MADFSKLVQKAFYLGVGLAAYATEKAGDGFIDLRLQAQKLVDELVERGELTSEDAQKMVNDMVQRAQQAAAQGSSQAPSSQSSDASAPRRIEIVEVEDTDPEEQAAQALRAEIATLQQELERLKREESSRG